MALFYNVLKDSRNNRKVDSQKQADEMTDIKRDIFMYGSDDVFLAFNKWLIRSVEQNKYSQTVQFQAFLNFVLEIRKDLCGGDTLITAEDILINLTQNEDDVKKLLTNNV